MLRNPSFWKTESDAPILGRNSGYVSVENSEARCKEAQAWLEFVPNAFKNEFAEATQRNIESTGDKEMDRLFYEDAVRTFSDERLRAEEVAALNAVFEVTQNYHQGLGFVVSFLLLFFKREDTVLLALFLNDRILPGYFKSHNREYLKDARVFERLLLERDPALGGHLKAHIVPGQYCSKWFIGMNVHVFPLEAVFKWFGTVLEHGNLQNFKLGLSIMQVNREALMKFQSASSMIELLRFDKSVYPDSLSVSVKPNLAEEEKKVPKKVPAKIADVEDPIRGSFFTNMIAKSLDIPIDEYHVQTLRQEVDRRMVIEEKERQKALEDISEDEIIFSTESDD